MLTILVVFLVSLSNTFGSSLNRLINSHGDERHLDNNSSIVKDSDHNKRRLVAPAIVASLAVVNTAASIVSNVFNYGVAIQIENWYKDYNLQLVNYYTYSGTQTQAAKPTIGKGKIDVAGAYSDKDWWPDHSSGTVRYRLVTNSYTTCIDVMWTQGFEIPHPTSDDLLVHYPAFGIGISKRRCTSDIASDHSSFISSIESKNLISIYNGAYQTSDFKWQSRGYGYPMNMYDYYAGNNVFIRTTMGNADKTTMIVEIMPCNTNGYTCA